MKVYYQILKYHYYMDDVIEGSYKLFNKHNKLKRVLQDFVWIFHKGK